MSELGKLMLIPCPIGENNIETIPNEVQNTVKALDFFVVERVRTARRYLKAVDKSFDIDGATFVEIQKDGDNRAEVKKALQALKQGKSVGLISEAGCPCVADPGYLFVRAAHQENISVVPFVGPSSIMLALMASGLNGQKFSFEGYLPIEKNDLAKHLKQIGDVTTRTGRSYVFIETPYRNKKVVEEILKLLSPSLYLSIAVDITAPTEWIKTKTIKSWKSTKDWSFLHKRPAILIIGAA